MTDPTPQLDQLIESARGSFRSISGITFYSWSLEAQWQAIAACDAVIIPSLDNETKNVKGPNRLIEASSTSVSERVFSAMPAKYARYFRAGG